MSNYSNWINEPELQVKMLIPFPSHKGNNYKNSTLEDSTSLIQPLRTENFNKCVFELNNHFSEICYRGLIS